MCGIDSVGNATKRERGALGLVDGKGGAGIAVAGLADRSRIDDVAGILFKAQRDIPLAFGDESVVGRAAVPKDDRQVSMTEEQHLPIARFERAPGILRVEDVVILVVR